MKAAGKAYLLHLGIGAARDDPAVALSPPLSVVPAVVPAAVARGSAAEAGRRARAAGRRVSGFR
uniref:hypothetical protein n=1 Tax=Nonomuraea pusilla TaxID=46177 RepID=UPI0006E1B778|nr:hypothetical protein [Nonomuraea pusilla]